MPAQESWYTEVLKLTIPAAIAVLGWFVAHFLTKRREDRTRRQQSLVDFRARQIEELYGPLQSLVGQVHTIWNVREEITNASKRAEEAGLSPAQIITLREFVWKQYFLPLHREIRTLLRNKQHLLEDGKMPRSFEEYIDHSLQEEFRHLLRDEVHIQTKFMLPTYFPRDFLKDVTMCLADVRAKYEDAFRVATSNKTFGKFLFTRRRLSQK